MEIKLLDERHIAIARDLFSVNKHMGVDPRVNLFTDKDATFIDIAYNTFCESYLSGLKNYKAFGAFNDSGQLLSYVSGYMSMDSPAWYLTMVRSKNRASARSCFDRILQYCEADGRFRFFSLMNLDRSDSFREFLYSPVNKERYSYVDEYIVPAKTKCIYTIDWNILFNRTLVPVDTIVKLSYLKPEYRTEIPTGGFI